MTEASWTPEPSDDKLHDECGVFGVWAPNRDPARMAYFGLRALQHRGQESAGIAVGDGRTVLVRKDLGLVTQVFSEADLAAMPGKVAIGHCRYGPAGAKGWESAQPHLSMINDVIIALAHNGTLVNFDALRGELIEMGIPFRSNTDSEVAAKLIGYFTQRGHRLRTGIAHTMRMLEGGYAMVLARENALYAFRDPHGIRPLVLGKLGEGEWVVASETCALDIVGASYVREVAPGEIIRISDDGFRSEQGVPPQPRADCIFEHVYFSYVPERKLIEDFNLSVEPGQRVAIVGPTGCGKTTLINLLMRFYDADAGSIAVEDRKLPDIPRRSLRGAYGMVLQETWLKHGTIRENIAMGKPDATEEEIVAAAKASHAHSFIRRLPGGYDTVIGEDGGQLSQGQKQLLCIARVMLRLPPILILDEATSSIDTRTELQIQSAFARLMTGRTSFIVAHRLSTIREADVILVMRDGKIIEQGNHESLLAQKGFYAELYNSQFAGVEEA